MAILMSSVGCRSNLLPHSTTSLITSFRGRGFSEFKNLPIQSRRRGAKKVMIIASSAEAIESQSGSSSNRPAAAAVNNVEQQEEQHMKLQKLNWNTQWYPVAVVKDLDKDAPTAATILGRPVAIWWDRSEWRVYADQCPHRLAPLSEGSISQEGHLRCSYHGWTYTGEAGQCTLIPQAAKDGPPAHTSKRACASVHPSMEQQGIIWLWPDLSQGAINLEAAAHPPPLFPELSDPTFKFDLTSRDMDYGYEALVENIVDPAHVPFAHHKIQGHRDYAHPLNYNLTTEITPEGFLGEDERSKAAFLPPCTFLLSFTLPPNLKRVPGTSLMSQGTNLTLNRKVQVKDSEKSKFQKKISLVLLCIPISPGRSRLIYAFPRNFDTFFVNIIPPWVAHMTNNLVFDSDLYLLHLQERRLEHEGNRNWFKRFYTPTKADVFVRAFRKWLNDFAGGAPDWGGRYENRLPPSPPKHILMDRYNSHVVKCKSCRNAVKNFKVLEMGLQVLAIALVGLVAASAVVPMHPVQSLAIPLVMAAVLSTLFKWWLANFIYKTFYFHDYNHATVK